MTEGTRILGIYSIIDASQPRRRRRYLQWNYERVRCNSRRVGTRNTKLARRTCTPPWKILRACTADTVFYFSKFYAYPAAAITPWIVFVSIYAKSLFGFRFVIVESFSQSRSNIVGTSRH